MSANSNVALGATAVARMQWCSWNGTWPRSRVTSRWTQVTPHHRVCSLGWGFDLYNAEKSYFMEKLLSVTTDGATVMTGHHPGQTQTFLQFWTITASFISRLFRAKNGNWSCHQQRPEVRGWAQEGFCNLFFVLLEEFKAFVESRTRLPCCLMQGGFSFWRTWQVWQRKCKDKNVSYDQSSEGF